jgi:hypothetical protein
MILIIMVLMRSNVNSIFNREVLLVIGMVKSGNSGNSGNSINSGWQ